MFSSAGRGWLLLVLVTAAARAAVGGSAAGFVLSINGRDYDWDRIGRFALPGETLHLVAADSGQGCGWVAASGELNQSRSGCADWVAPEGKGLYSLLAVCGAQTKVINVFVMVPYESLHDGRINGARVGRYPAEAPFPSLRRPRGFIELDPETETVAVSQHYRLGDFYVNRSGACPDYIALTEDIIYKVELLADFVRGKGIDFERFKVISGFRSPARQRDNRGRRQSAHMYGGAADITIDANDDRMMDDINRDGHCDRKDAQLLVRYVDEFEELHPELVGGAGWYRKTRSRTPFVHIDVRGERARWYL